MDESAEHVATLDRLGNRLPAEVVAVGRDECKRTVGSLGVVVDGDEPLVEGVRLGRSDRRVDYPDAFAAEHFVEGGAELAVAVVGLTMELLRQPLARGRNGFGSIWRFSALTDLPLIATSCNHGAP